MNKPCVLKRIWTAPQLGVLAGLGLIGVIFFLTVARIVVAIIVDWVHCLKTKDSKDV